MTIDDFIRRADNDNLTTLERARALLWWIGRDDPIRGLTAREVCDVLQRNGHPKQNISRLQSKLANDRATTKAGLDSWRVTPRIRKQPAHDYSDVFYGCKLPLRPGMRLPPVQVHS